MEQPGQGRVEFLDAMRGVLALGVMAYHVLLWTGIADLYNLGLFGVYAFFLLSGFALAYVYEGRAKNEGWITRFYVRRFFRLAPLWLVVLFIVVAVQRPSALLVLLNATFAFGLVDPGATSLITGGWSIGIEWVYYLAFPALLAILLGRSLVTQLLILAATTVLGFLYSQSVIAGSSTFESAWVPYTQPLSFVMYFVAGIVIAMNHDRLPRLAWAWSGMLGAAFLALLFLLPSSSEVDLLAGPQAIVGFSLALLAVGSFSCSGPMPRLLRACCKVLGDLSYPAYLLHPLVFDALNGWSSLRGGSLVLAVAAAVVLASLVSAKSIEAWGQDWGRRLLAHWRGRAMV